jgi:hypothetical protein
MGGGSLQRVGEGEADGEDGSWVEWRFAGDGADAVRSKELAGCTDCVHDLDSGKSEEYAIEGGPLKGYLRDSRTAILSRGCVLLRRFRVVNLKFVAIL